MMIMVILISSGIAHLPLEADREWVVCLKEILLCARPDKYKE
jgi:hypothetical protein